VISVSPISGGASGAAAYYTEEQARAEYYSAEAVPSAWRGSAAQALGLRGPVAARDLENVLAGRVTDATGEERQLGTTRGGQHQHRAGWDFTISAPKSVSVQALVHGDRAALEAHRRAADAALGYLERHGAAYRPQSGVYKEGQGLAVATFEHVSSRARDPQLHTHAVVANVTIDAEGRARSLSNERLFSHRRAADAVYHATLSRELERAGYAVRFDRDGRVEIDHYKREQLRDFSTRAQDIEAALAARGLTREQASAAMRNTLALDTRQVKALPETREAHAARWQAQAEALGVTPAKPEARTLPREPEHEAAARAIDRATAHLTEREAVFNQADLHREALRFAQGRAGIEAIEREIAQREKAGELLRSDEAQKGARYTTREALEQERDTERRLQNGKGAHQAVMSPREFEAALREFEARKGFDLSQEQREASRMILTSDDRFQGVQGLAGTGKTTMLEFVREAAEKKGWEVRGHSNGAEQAAVLERESGIKSDTTARHLVEQARALKQQGREPGEIAPPRKELRIMDEASMAGQRAFADVARTTEASGARTVMLGDSRQHQSVERGRAFERAQAHMPTATLGEASIRRQKTEQLKAAVADVLHKREAQALARLEVREIAPERRQVVEQGKDRLEQRAAAARDNAHVVRQIARDYAALPHDKRAATLVLTSTNADRKALNAAIRDELQKSGALGQDAAQARVLRAADMTREDSRRAASYREGQVIEVTTGRGREARTERMEIERIDSRANTLYARDEQGRERQIDPAQRGQRVAAYDAESRGIAPGDRVRFTENHTLPDGQRVRNGQVATVERIDAERVHLRLGDGKTAQHLAADARALKADHDYAVTSYSAQGRTVDRVMIHHNTEAGRHSDRETYVNITRAREGASVYTQDQAKMERQIGLESNKSAAHDVAAEKERQQQAERAPQRERDGWGR